MSIFFNIMKTLTALIIVLFISCSSYATERNFIAEISSNVTAPGRQIEMSLIFPETDVVSPEMPFLPGINFKYKEKIIDQVKGTITFKYLVISSKTGDFTIGPLVTGYNGDIFKSNPVTFSVKKGEYEIVELSDHKLLNHEDLDKHIFIDLITPEKALYVNEKAFIKLQFYSDWLDVENIKILESFQPKEFIENNFKKVNSSFIEKEGIKYIVLEYIKEIFSPLPGELMLSPVEVRFNVVRPPKEKESDFYLMNDNLGFYKQYLGRKKKKNEVLISSSKNIRIIDLPEDKPLGFNGAVGDFNVQINEDWSEFEKYRKIKYSTTILGEGNYDSIVAPVFLTEKGIKVYPENKIKKEKSFIYEQTVKVVDNELVEIPAYRFVFFSPTNNEYKVIQKGPFVLEKSGNKKSEEKPGIFDIGIIPEKQEWISSIKHSLGKGFLKNYEIFSFVIVLILVIFEILFFSVGLYLYRKKWIMTSNNPKAIFIRTKKMSKKILSKAKALYLKGKNKEFCDIVFSGLQGYFAELLGLSASNITASAIKVYLKDSLKTDCFSFEINEIFSYCYKGKFSNLKIEQDDTKTVLEKMSSLLNDFGEIGLEIIKTRIAGRI